MTTSTNQKSKAAKVTKKSSPQTPAPQATQAGIDPTIRRKTARTQGPEDQRTPRKLSALDAAAKVLAESEEPLTSKALIEFMASRGYWSSPGGQTPHATLYAAILREIQTKGAEARFVKTDRGHFALNR